MNKHALKALTVAGLILFSAPAFAEHNEHKEEGSYGEKRVEKLKEKLSLSDEQTAQIQAILKESEPTQEEKDAFKKKMQDRMKTTDDKISAVLTEEQRAKYAELKEKRKEQRKEGKGKFHGKRHKEGMHEEKKSE